ncbi:midasin [Gloeopeniophorella convolvens]|nr:midasin [Gloeopeniophorella convolvens]
MSLPDRFKDPLVLDIGAQWLVFTSRFPTWNGHHQVNLVGASSKELLSLASKFLFLPSCTTVVASLFRPLLLDLCARWLENAEAVEDKLCAFCLLLQPHTELFPVLSTFLQEFVPRAGPLSLIPDSTPLAIIPSSSLHRILLAYYRLLQANPDLPNQLDWPLEPLSRLFWAPHPDVGVRYLAIRCYALQSGMSEMEREQLENAVVGSMAEVNCPLEHGMDPQGRVNVIDGWLLPVIEAQRIHDARNAIATDTQEFPTSQGIQSSDLSSFVTSVHGVLMHRRPGPSMTPDTPLVPTNAAIGSLRSLALHISLRLPVLLTSAHSSGKTLLLKHLASTLHPGIKTQLVTVNLADTSIDSRSLLGSYASSAKSPGTFEWKEGVLVRAMRSGRWVVFEDIDKASAEVLGTIKPLVESLGAGKWVGGRAKLSVPSRGEVIASETFAIFATRSVTATIHGVFNPPTFFGAHKFHEVVVPAPTQEELCIIIAALFPRLAGPAARGITVLWTAIRSLGSSVSGREIGLRDLQKCCSRLDALLPSSYQPMVTDTPRMDLDNVGTLSVTFPNPTLREEMYLEARDVFFGAGPLTAASHAHATAIAAVVAEHLGLTQEKCDWLLHNHVPEFANEVDVNGRTSSLRLGRIRLPARTDKLGIVPPPARPFAMHRPAVSLMTRIASAVSMNEPVLLTGETGTGKTSVVTHMASLLRRNLISLNLSQQTESSDLLGSFKPIDARIPGSELQLQFLDLFRSTFSQKKNVKFEESTWKAVHEGKWKRAVGLWKESVRLAKDRIGGKLRDVEGGNEGTDALDSEAPRKRRRTGAAHFLESERNWAALEQEVLQFEAQHITKKGKFAFSFVEGPLVRALRSGDWILLDEINLASSETLEAVSSLLRGPGASVTLTEQGSMEPVPRHPDFRLFACMNPATDVGKKDLPPNIRSYFTEIDVPSPDADRETLLAIVKQYIGPSTVSDKGAIMDAAEFYTAVKALSNERHIADGSNRRPHFSMRTLARALTFAADIASAYSVRRALWEGCLMAFTMVLDTASAKLVTALAQKHLLNGVRNVRLLLTREPAPPQSRPLEDFVKFGPFYLERGALPELPTDDYILTPSVEKKLIDLARIILTRRFPVLIEGPTSSGKTSSIEYMAKRTGHRFVRINNHEHTDIQEYLGTYVSDPVTGKLVFKDGLLVQALRNGDWIVLDELNLAPTDVLEALNRLLDDNRELVIPETQEVIKPHPHFMLFATQNPPGLYAGRKVLSRAFRNRFLEVHFEDVPQAELETILCQRCRIAPSYAQRIVAVFRELQKRRQSSRVFESKQGFATLRDLFRWAGRDAVGYQELAENGYMLLAERARREDDKVVVKDIIEAVMRVRIDEATLYDLDRHGSNLTNFLGFGAPSSSNIVWTKAMQRLLVLVGRALHSKEPVLLVGETGSGKTSICQVYADAVKKHLYALNCHQNTETADLIGGLRPIRNKPAAEAEVIQEASMLLSQHGISGIPRNSASLLVALDQLEKSQLAPAKAVQDVRQKLQRLNGIFEWHDGPLVEAMRGGDVLLLDEISLADDSVLERLNSVIEHARTLVLAEKGGDSAEGSLLKAAPGFQLVATMNPGGDFGKKELSPALRNRFTEIWVPPVNERADLTQIVASSWRHDRLRTYTGLLLDFMEWLSHRVSEPSLFGLRDVLAWVVFSNSVLDDAAMEAMPLHEIFHHAAHMTCLDGLGSLPALSGYSPAALRKVKEDALAKLQELAPISTGPSAYVPDHDAHKSVQLGIFAIPRGPRGEAAYTYDIQAPTTRDNVMRVVRASQLSKPILLEGSPGVGKTSLITTLAKICGYHLCRINLSDQTDLADLFGADLPVDGGRPGEFAWKDAEFLKAMQEGHWVLLDEMNLAPQSVLEGLNAVLDHRGTVYVPELGRSFSRHPSFRIFAAQNPLQQGGGRKGLPKSYVNRFTKVYVDPLTPADLLQISKHMYPNYPADWLQRMIAFNSRLEEETSVKHSFGRSGSPWEFNLRDVFRWGALLQGTVTPFHPVEHLRTVYLARFRSDSDRDAARRLFDSIFEISSDFLKNAPYPSISSSSVKVGHFLEGRRSTSRSSSRPGVVLQAHLPWIEAMGVAMQQGWLVIVSGPSGSGKTSLTRLMAELFGHTLQEVSVNHATDTMDILGSYEQVDGTTRTLALVRRVVELTDNVARTFGGSKNHASLSLSNLRIPTASSSAVDSLPDLLRTALNTLDGLADLDTRLEHERNALREQIRTELAASKVTGQFEWVDGPLIRALKEGHWLLLDGANLCSPSVLDRLNSLCEPSGVLSLNERGLVDGAVPVIVPHPDFRLVMCVDPQFGELSRAMRNRGVEISLPPTRSHEDVCRIRDLYFLPSPLHDPNVGDVSAVGFEMERRCLFVVSPLPGTAVSLPSTVSVQDSSALTVVDRTMSIIPRNTLALQSPAFAILNVFVRSLVPDYANHFARFISEIYSSDKAGHLRSMHLVLDAVKGEPNWLRLEQLRQYTWPVSSLLLRTQVSAHRITALAFGIGIVTTCTEYWSQYIQSMDFFMKPTDFTRSFTDPDYPAAQKTILRAFELFVRTSAYNTFEGSPVRRPPLRDDDKIAERSSAILSHVDELARMTKSYGVNLLQRAPSLFGPEASVEIQVIIELLKYIAFLQPRLRDILDFSLLQAVSSWIQYTLQSAPAQLSELARHAEALSRAVTPTSGLGLSDIWSSWTNFGDLNPSSTFELDQGALSVSNDEDGHKIRSQLLDIMVAKGLPAEAAPLIKGDTQDILAVVKERRSQNLAPSEPESAQPTVNKFSVMKELYILSRMRGGHTMPALGNITMFACSDRGMSLQRFIPYRRAILHPGKLTEPAITLSAFGSWLQALWEHGDPSGPSIILQPTQLSATIGRCDWRDVTLQSLPLNQESLQRHSYLFTTTANLDSDNLEDLATLYRETLSILASCFSQSFDESALLELRASSHGPHSLAQLMALLMRSSYPWFTSSVSRQLTEAVARIEVAQSRLAITGALGHGWIALFRLFADLYIPDTPLDPASLRNARSDFWGAELASLSNETDLEISLERRITGNTTSGTIEYLNDQLHHVRNRLESLPHTVSKAGRSIVRLQELWSEVSQFMLKVISQSKLDRLLHTLHANEPAAPASEHVIQESIARFSQRLSSVYPEFDDIGRPLQFALLSLRLGLRLVAHSCTQEETVAMDDLARALTMFPSIGGAGSLIAMDADGDVRTVGTTPYDFILLTLSSIALEVDAGVDAQSHVESIEEAYEQAVRLWLINQKKREEADAASQTLYRSNQVAHDAVSDSKLEEEELLALFPDYESLLEQDLPEDGDRSVVARHAAAQNDSRASLLMGLHLRILLPKNDSLNVQEQFSDLRDAFLALTLGKHEGSLSDLLDRHSFSYQLSLIASRLRSYQEPGMTARPFNFYADPHIPEIRRAGAIVDLLKQRLDAIIQEWPEQMVLQHLRDRCNQILALSAETPMAKALAILELLLLQTDDWEMYANKENTLKTHRQALTELIVSWRRLELSSWRGLLRTQSLAFEEGISEWWFRLYNAVVRGVLDVVDRDSGEGVDGYLDSLVPLLDDFLKSSPLGQFSRRLDLLQSFEPLLDWMARSKPEWAGDALRRVRYILHSTQAYYSQFAPRIRSSLAAQHKDVETDIQGFIKLASWKDVNVQALKASAKRTHHQLYKSVRKYREILRQPIASLLQPEQASEKEILSGSDYPLPLPQPSTGVNVIPDAYATHSEGPAHLRDLHKTFKKFDSLISTRIQAFITSRPSHEVDAITEQIVFTAKELSSVVIPTGVSPERKEKLWKALLVRKRKAWSDFTKELRGVGLATNVQSTILLQQQNARRLREQPTPVVADGEYADVRKSEQCFVRLEGLLPGLRTALSNHHSEISTRELQRGVMLLESALSLSLSVRKRLSNTLETHRTLKAVSKRLDSLSRHPDVSVWGRSGLDAATSTKAALDRMYHAVTEAIYKTKEFSGLPGAMSTPVALVEAAEALLSTTQDLRSSLRSLEQDVHATVPSVLLADELATVVHAQKHIFTSQEQIAAWAESYPQLKALFTPLSEWLRSQKLGAPSTSSSQATSDTNADQAIEVFLKAIQSILSALPSEEDQTLPQTRDNYLKETSLSLIRVDDSLRVQSKVELLNSLVARLAVCSPETTKRELARLLPFVRRYTLLVEEHLVGMARWMYSLSKLELVACSVMLNISVNGFCRPPDMDESGDSGKGDEAAAGVGFGEGAGNENVSKEIEDESQVEGLKDEGEEAKKKDDNPRTDNDAVEMGEDFQGELEDVPEPGSEEENESGDEDGEGPDDTLDDLDSRDPDAVDEKLWGDEKGPQDDGKLDKTNDDRSKKASADSEMVAKGGESSEKGENPQDPEPAEADREGEEPDQKDEVMPEEPAAEDGGEPAPDGGGTPLDDYVQDADTLNLPDDLEMNEDSNEQPAGEDMDEDVFEEAADPVSNPPEGEDGTQENAPPEPSSHPVDEAAGDEDADGQRQEGEDAEAPPEDAHLDEDVAMQPDVQPGDGSSAQDASPDKALNSNVREDNQESQSGGAQGAKASGKGDEAQHDDADAQNQLPEGSAVEEATGSSGANAGTETGLAPSHDSIPGDAPSDHQRSQGDAMKETSQRMDDILESDQTTIEQAMADLQTSQLQYLHDDDVDHEMQALGPAGIEEAAKLSELRLSDDAERNEHADQMDVDDPYPPASAPDPPHSPSLPSESTEAFKDDVQKALSPHDVRSQRPVQNGDTSVARDAPKAESETETPEAEYVELALRQWQAEGQPAEGAENLWRLYESLTQDLSYALCEQLRLILEPTLTTRLKGDYRTGKRLNMKKIIPYIASEFTKDKIWLRRTRPSQREYQVFIALDDSRSMAESHSIHLAYETLALVSKALTRLEVGDIGIAKFGEAVDVLHGFDDGPLTDQAGVQVMSAFGFNQKATNVLSLVEASLRILGAARESGSSSSSTAADLWQLGIIISDGICQDHEKLRTALRRAEEQRVMIVFIIIDSLHSTATSSTTTSAKVIAQNSILSMNQAAYKNVDGRMELQMQRYLDSFPFEYYVVLRSVEALPEVLSGTLKQFFERISDE